MPASNPQISIRISSKSDEFAAGLAQVKKDLADLPKLAEKISRDMGRTSARFASFDMAKPVSRFAGAARGGIGRGLGVLGSVPGLGAIAGVASIAGFGEMISRFASAGVELQNTARLAGTSAAGLNSLRGAARMIGLTAGDADSAIGGLQHTLADAAFGRNTDAARQFQAFGVDFGNMTTGARSAEQVLPQIVDTLTRLAKVNPNAAERLAGIWGIPPGALPLLIRGNEALSENRRQIEAMFGSMDKYQAASAGFTRSTATLSLASEHLGYTIMSAVEPHLTPMINRLTRFVEDHNTDIGQTFDRIGTAVENIQWDKVGQGVESVGNAISFATRNADLMTTAMEALAANWLVRQLFGRGIIGALGTTAGALALPLALSGDTPGSGNGRPFTPEEMAEGRRRQQAENARYGYNGNFFHDTWQWLTGGGRPSSRVLPGGPMGGFENNIPLSEPGSPGAGVLNLIGRAEGTDRGRGYNETLAYGKWTGGVGRAGDQNLTAMTLDQIDALQTQMIARQIAAGVDPARASSALGRYQFTRTTLRDLRQQYNLPGNHVFDQGMQDRLVGMRIRSGGGPNRGLNEANLARIWASFPDPENGGRSHYAGQRASITADEVRAAIAGGAPPDAASGRPQSPAERFRFPMHDDPSTWPKPPSNDGQSTVKIEIDHSGVPDGVNMRATTKGDGAEIAGINVRRAMPQAGQSPFNPFAGP